MLRHCRKGRVGLDANGMSTAKKIGIGLLVAVLILAVAGWFVTRPDKADLDWAAVTGTDPQLSEPESETFPTVRIAEPVGWAAGAAPTAARCTPWSPRRSPVTPRAGPG